GAGRRGLGAMRPVRGRVWRPLLAATRADVRRFLAERGLGFAVDRTNADLRHARNRVRRLLVPLLRAEFNPRLGPALAALAERLRDEADFLAAGLRPAARGPATHAPVRPVRRQGAAREPRAPARARRRRGDPLGAGPGARRWRPGRARHDARRRSRLRARRLKAEARAGMAG